jgi:hypothetical protein
MQFLFVNVFPKYFNFVTFSKAILAIFVLLFCPSFFSIDLDFSTFTARLATNKAFIIFSNGYFRPINKHHQKRLEADVFQSV